MRICRACLQKCGIDNAGTTLMQQQFKQWHGIDVTVRQIEDALMVLKQ